MGDVVAGSVFAKRQKQKQLEHEAQMNALMHKGSFELLKLWQEYDGTNMPGGFRGEDIRHVMVKRNLFKVGE